MFAYDNLVQWFKEGRGILAVSMVLSLVWWHGITSLSGGSMAWCMWSAGTLGVTAA